MVHKILTWFLYIYVFSFSCQLPYFTAMCDIIIKNDSLNQIAFAVGSDFVQTGCGSFLNPAYLILSNPLDACRIPKEPPSKKDRIDHWILLAVENSNDAYPSYKDCDFKTKFRNAADAGYSAIIIGTEDFHEEIIFPGLITEDDEEFIDVHLINPADIKALSKYAYPKPFVVIPPTRHRCREEYRKSWIRSRYGSHTLRQWKEIKLSILTNIKDASNLINRAFISHLSILLRKASDSTETLLYWSCVVIIPLSPIVLLVYSLLFSENYSYKNLPKGEQNEPYSAFPRRNQKESSSKEDPGAECKNNFTNEDQKKKYCNDFSKEDRKKEYCNDFSKEDRKKEYCNDFSKEDRKKEYCNDFSKEDRKKEYCNDFSKEDRKKEYCNDFSKEDRKKEYCNDFSKEDRKKEYCNDFSKENHAKQNYVFNEQSRQRSQNQSDKPPLFPVKGDYTLYHRINLGIKLNAMLTKAEVNSAYRKFALKYHPDKHRHLDVKEVAKITEEFRSKTKSRDILLSYCTK
ncbi:unnamed protein product [Orchesella dallaii]|uniref:J domain-containing protein n=1 Tax=Orchesella dallaii TaxID=48710 RepID=A0ABP1QA16_9HEXA